MSTHREKRFVAPLPPLLEFEGDERVIARMALEEHTGFGVTVPLVLCEWRQLEALQIALHAQRETVALSGLPLEDCKAQLAPLKALCERVLGGFWVYRGRVAP